MSDYSTTSGLCVGHGLTDSDRTDYRKELQSPHRLSKYDVAEHLQRYATDFYLNVMLSTTVKSTTYDQVKKEWTCKLQSAGQSGIKTIVCKHLVQATGIGSGSPYMPSIKDESTYKGLSIHSTQYRNAQQLVEQGIKVCASFPFQIALGSQ